jgi:sugar phosphate permease
MDIGGRHMAGFALGVINSFQYFGAILAGWVLGMLIDTDKEKWIPLFAAMLPFSLIATVLMAVLAWRTRGREVRGA